MQRSQPQRLQDQQVKRALQQIGVVCHGDGLSYRTSVGAYRCSYRMSIRAPSRASSMVLVRENLGVRRQLGTGYSVLGTSASRYLRQKPYRGPDIYVAA